MLGRSSGSGAIEVAVGECTARDVAAHSSSALDVPLRHAAALSVGVLTDDALVLGAFQRAVGLPDRWPLARRGSGGPEVRIGPESVYVGLSVAHPGAAPLEADARRIVNRAVRPLLRALSRTGCAAAFFGRDWISVGRQPAAWVGFAHDAATQRTLFEAFVAVRVPFAIQDRPSFRGKAPGTLELLAPRPVDPRRLASAIVDAYVEGYAERPAPIAMGSWARSSDPAPPSQDPWDEPPWTATCQEAIGLVGAGPDRRGAFRVGGDLMVSRDALARLEANCAAAADVSDAGLERVVRDALESPRVALEGVRSLTSIRDVIARALRDPSAPRFAPP